VPKFTNIPLSLEDRNKIDTMISMGMRKADKMQPLPINQVQNIGSGIFPRGVPVDQSEIAVRKLNENRLAVARFEELKS